jgi:hypothetical protein
MGVGAHILGGEFVLALPASFYVSGQFVSAKKRALLNADAMNAENRHVRGDRDLVRRTPLNVDLEPVYARVLPLVKAEIPDLHDLTR